MSVSPPPAGAESFYFSSALRGTRACTDGTGASPLLFEDRFSFTTQRAEKEKNVFRKSVSSIPFRTRGLMPGWWRGTYICTSVVVFPQHGGVLLEACPSIDK